MCELSRSQLNFDLEDWHDSGFIDQDPLQGLGEREEEKSYKLEEIIFAEPIEFTNKDLNCENGKNKENKIFAFVDKVTVEKRAGKRNKYHINIKDASAPVCPEVGCKKRFSTITLLKAHVRKVHCAELKHMCEVCGKGFAAQYLLRRHRAVHDGGKVQCVVCEKLLSKRTNLSAHMRFVHRQGELTCDKCDQRFEKRNLYVRHRASHTI